jgi:hypothetical protein
MDQKSAGCICSCCMSDGLFDGLWSDACALALSSPIIPEPADVLSSAMDSSESGPFFLSLVLFLSFILTTTNTILFAIIRSMTDACIDDGWFTRVCFRMRRDDDDRTHEPATQACNRRRRLQAQACMGHCCSLTCRPAGEVRSARARR